MIAICLVSYAIAALFVARRAFAAMRAEDMRKHPNLGFDGEGAILFGLLATIVGALWPLSLVIGIVIYKPRKAPEELKAERDAARRRIAELEREVGIR